MGTASCSQIEISATSSFVRWKFQQNMTFKKFLPYTKLIDSNKYEVEEKPINLRGNLSEIILPLEKGRTSGVRWGELPNWFENASLCVIRARKRVLPNTQLQSLEFNNNVQMIDGFSAQCSLIPRLKKHVKKGGRKKQLKQIPTQRITSLYLLTVPCQRRTASLGEEGGRQREWKLFVWQAAVNGIGQRESPRGVKYAR